MLQRGQPQKEYPKFKLCSSLYSLPQDSHPFNGNLKCITKLCPQTDMHTSTGLRNVSRDGTWELGIEPHFQILIPFSFNQGLFYLVEMSCIGYYQYHQSRPWPSRRVHTLHAGKTFLYLNPRAMLPITAANTQLDGTMFWLDIRQL